MGQIDRRQEPALFPGKDAPAPAQKSMLPHVRTSIEEVTHGC